VACLKKNVLVLVVCALTGLTLSCGGYNNGSSSTTGGTSGLKFRALLSQDVQDFSAGLIIIDANKDRRALVPTIGGSGGNSGLLPAMMVESNDRKLTLAIGSSGSSFSVMDNVKEAMSVINVALPGASESAVISVDNTKAYFAVPTAPVPGGGTAGGIFISSLTAANTSTLPIPAAHYLAQSGDGSRLLIFSDGVFEIFRDEGAVWNLDACIAHMSALAEPQGSLMDELLDHVYHLRGSARLDDDFSIIEARFCGYPGLCASATALCMASLTADRNAGSCSKGTSPCARSADPPPRRPRRPNASRRIAPQLKSRSALREMNTRTGPLA